MARGTAGDITGSVQRATPHTIFTVMELMRAGRHPSLTF